MNGPICGIGGGECRLPLVELDPWARLLFFPPHDEPAVRVDVAMNRDLGVNIETLAPSDATCIVSQLETDAIAQCAYKRDAEYADAVATTYAYAERARSLGVGVGGDPDPVTGLVAFGGRITAVEATACRIDTGAVNVAAGSRTNRVVGPIVEPLPIVAARVQMAHFGRAPQLGSLRAIAIDRATGAYFREGAGRGTLVGAEGPGTWLRSTIQTESP